MKKLLITGALGHIGSKFIHGIKKNEYDEVRLLDNLSTHRYCSLFNLPKGVNFDFIEDDICTANLKDYFKGIDIVLHLAAVTDAETSFRDKEKVEEVNLEGTRRVAEACTSCGSKLIFLSTTSVYGTQREVVDENCSMRELRPQSPYAESKLKAEQLLTQLGRHDLEYIAFRFGTIFGPSIGMRFHTAINKFIWQACLGKPLTVWHTALNQKRPYLDLRDAVRALKFVIDKDIFDKDIYNALTLNATVSEILDLIKLFVPQIKVKYVDSKIMNQLSYTVRCEKFKSLGFSFKGDLKEAIKDTVNLLRGAK